MTKVKCTFKGENMSVENSKVCCNCRHCIRERDEMPDANKDVRRKTVDKKDNK